MTAENKKELSQVEQEELLGKLKARFEKNTERHQGLEWNPIQAKLEEHSDKLISLYEMERTEGEPDVIGYDEEREEYIFVDCSKESPKGRRSVCYDRAALESRKKHKPEKSAIDMATDMGIEMLTEDQYRELQKLGTFDAKTSTWVKTPTDIRERGGALFVISVLGMFSYIIMARNPIMVPVGSGGCYECSSKQEKDMENRGMDVNRQFLILFYLYKE